MKTQLLSNWSAVQALAPDWQRLAGAVPFRTWAWLSSWWREYAQEHRPFILTAHNDGGEVVGIAPWYVEDGGALGRVVRQLGTGDVCSDYLSLLVKPGLESEVGAAFGLWLTSSESLAGPEGKLARWDLIELANVPPADASRDAMQKELAEVGTTIHQRPAMSCWRIALPATWEEYAASLSKGNRRRVRDCHKRLQQPDAARHIAKTPAELQAGWRVLVELHQQRRQSLGEPGCFASGEFEQFLLSASEQFLAQGTLRLSWIELGGSPAACSIGIRGGDVLYVYQMGMSIAHKDESPGWLAQSAAIADAIAEGCTGYDLLRGDEPYKGHLKAQPQPMIDVRIVPRRLAPQLRHTAWLTGLALKGAFKLGLAATGVMETGIH